MNKDVIVSISGNHLITDEQDSVEIISRGKLYTRNGKTYVTYNESDNEDHITNCVIRYDDNTVQVRKSDTIGMNCMVFERDHNCVTSYKTPLGSMIAGFATTKLDIIKNEDREIIRIEYMLDINYTYVSDCTVEINIIYQ
jgi:hypothetical protein